MVDICVNGLTKSYDLEKIILDSVSFEIYEGEKVGLIGKNGAGKTTLFRILTNESDCDAGDFSIAQGKRMGLISQIPVYPDEYSVEDVLKSAYKRVYDIQNEMISLERRMEKGNEPEIIKRYGELSSAFEACGGYSMDVQTDKVANGLKITPGMRHQKFSSLSGGEKTRINLARLILENTDILLLDEPTNHLDMRSTEWLEEYLLKFKGTVLTVSHDRYFLDRVVTRVIELEDG